MVFWMEPDAHHQLCRVPCRRTVILKQMAEVGSAVVYKTARRNVSAINFGWMPNAWFKRRKKGCQITQYGVCLAVSDDTLSHELIGSCEMNSWLNLYKMISHPHKSVHRFELLATSKGKRHCWEMLLTRRTMLASCLQVKNGNELFWKYKLDAANEKKGQWGLAFLFWVWQGTWWFFAQVPNVFPKRFVMAAHLWSHIVWQWFNFHVYNL